jgi:TonB family protein
MSTPQRVAGASPRYTQEALDAKVQGMIEALCLIEADGRIYTCGISKGLPLMNGEVVSALRTWTMKPVTRGGKPVAVRYVLPIRLKTP